MGRYLPLGRVVSGENHGGRISVSICARTVSNDVLEV